MNDERRYGLEGGDNDAATERHPQVELTLEEGSDYEHGYIDGYKRGRSDLGYDEPGAPPSR